MVICPIALAVHCTGCPFFKFCPAKTTLGDYKKGDIDKTSVEKETNEDNIHTCEEKPRDPNNQVGIDLDRNLKSDLLSQLQRKMETADFAQTE